MKSHDEAARVDSRVRTVLSHCTAQTRELVPCFRFYKEYEKCMR